ncbi:DUF3450 domain-containing protein [Crocosphaera chwakensis]|uniref:Uncharacterized protein n=1 Tax=Crocosphaera chwakensis CCY0110 TaxID=391612 RepID=A3IRM8_9CHRO|nr:hypothetical protein [Crocosphaera chwakensis]EAZ90877.1 hypothetical protein CY0110_25641 [Crocosphaera chwakensis CCY0110]
MLPNYKTILKMTVDIDTRVKSVYKLAKAYPDNGHLQEAVGVVKTLRRSQGQLAHWSDQHKIDKKQLKAEIITLSKENQELEVQIRLKSENIVSLKSELTQINEQMTQLTEEKRRMIVQRDRVVAELKQIETEVEIATIKVQQTNDLFEKFSIIWTLIQSLFFRDHHKDYGKIENTPEPDPDKPQMGTSPADIGKNLLDN